MPTIRLLVTNEDRRQGLEQTLRLDPASVIVAKNPALETDAEVGLPGADAIVVDLAHPRAIDPRFWATLHLLYPFAGLVAITDTPLDQLVIATALQAGAICMVTWAEPTARLLRALQAAMDQQGFIPVGLVLQAMCDFFGSQNPIPQTVTIGPFQLDLQRRQLMSDGSTIPLTPLEFEFLRYLSVRAGQVISHSELAREVWGQPFRTPGQNAKIKSTVKRLRLKLESDPDEPVVLLSVYGHGYYIPKLPR